MHVRVITVQGDPAKVDDGISFVRDEVGPKMEQMPGSRGLSMWVERSSGRAVVASFWDDADALKASEAGSVGFRADGAARLGGQPTVEVFEMAVLHRVEPVQPGG